MKTATQNKQSFNCLRQPETRTFLYPGPFLLPKHKNAPPSWGTISSAPPGGLNASKNTTTSHLNVYAENQTASTRPQHLCKTGPLLFRPCWLNTVLKTSWMLMKPVYSFADKTLEFKGVDCHGCKNRKERLTVMVYANMAGSEIMPLLVIGK